MSIKLWEFCFKTRQQVCLIYSFRGHNFARFFYKKPCKIATSKKLFKATACRLSKTANSQKLILPSGYDCKFRQSTTIIKDCQRALFFKQSRK